jgi:hypothetical protein
MMFVAAIVAASLLCANLLAGAPLSIEQRLTYARTTKETSDFFAAVDSTRPLAYYRLNAMMGSSRGGGTRYKAEGGVSIAKPGAPINVADNQCVELDGKDGYILTTQAGGIGKAASMMAWVNLASLPSGEKHFFYVMGESQDSNDLDLQFEDDDALKFYTASGSHLTFTPKHSTLVNQWHLIVVTVNTATKARVIYWDGDEVASDKEGGMPNKTSLLSIGESTVFGGRFFKGGIEEAAIWDRALSAAEAYKIYRAGQNAAN